MLLRNRHKGGQQRFKARKESQAEKFDRDYLEDRTQAAKQLMWNGSEFTAVRHTMTLCQFAVDLNGLVLVRVHGHAEATQDHHRWLDVHSREFKLWLAYLHGAHTLSGLYEGELKRICLEIEAKVSQTYPRQPIYKRFANLDDRIILNLNRPTGEVVEISAKGCVVLDESPVVFIHHGLPLPVPEEGGSLDQLRPFLNVDETSFVNICAWLISVLWGNIQSPILCIIGPPESAKSTTMEFIRQIIDPDKPAVMAMPKSTHDLNVVAANKALLAFNNISRISDALSDALCCIQSEGGAANRQLHSDAGVSILENRCPMMVNGVVQPTYREDFISRCVFAYTREITATARISHAKIKADFEQCHPQILGVFLQGLVSAFQRRDEVKLEKTPRFADAAILMTAAEPGLGLKQGTFVDNYFQNQQENLTTVMENSPIAGLIQGVLLRDQSRWEGTMTKILSIGALHEKEYGKLPQTPQALVAQLERLRPVLKTFDIGWERLKATREERPHVFFRLSQQQASEQPVHPNSQRSSGRVRLIRKS